MYSDCLVSWVEFKYHLNFLSDAVDCTSHGGEFGDSKQSENYSVIFGAYVVKLRSATPLR